MHTSWSLPLRVVMPLPCVLAAGSGHEEGVCFGVTCSASASKRRKGANAYSLLSWPLSHTDLTTAVSLAVHPHLLFLFAVSFLLFPPSSSLSFRALLSFLFLLSSVVLVFFLRLLRRLALFLLLVVASSHVRALATLTLVSLSLSLSY